MKKIDDVARAIIAHNPNTNFFDHVIIGLDKPLDGSATGVTWRDIQKLAKIIVEKKTK